MNLRKYYRNPVHKNGHPGEKTSPAHYRINNLLYYKGGNLDQS